jgi:hypothetical protein
MITALIAAIMLGQGPAGKLTEPLRKLASEDRRERHAACEVLRGAKSLPESAIEPIISYLKLEIEQAMLPPPREHRLREGAVATLPIVGDETSIARIKANPQEYIGKDFILVGGIKVSDYYNFGFSNAAADFYSFRMRTATQKGDLTSDDVAIYVSRFDGAVLAELATKSEEQKGDVLLAVRLHCTIHAQRLEGDTSHAADSIEATDWQVLAPDGRLWMPWTFESITLGYTLLFKAGSASMPACLELIMNEHEFQSERADKMLKGTAIGYVLMLPKKDRTLAFRRVSLKAKRVKSAVAKKWTKRLYESLEAGRLVI